MTGAEKDAALRRLRRDKKNLIDMHNRNCETIRCLRAKMETLEAERSYTIDNLQALLDGLGPMVVETADDGGNSEAAGGDMKPLPRITPVNVMRYWLRKVWEGWATNPHQAPAFLYAMGFLVLVVWIFGNVAVGIYDGYMDVGTQQGLKMVRGLLGAVPGAFQLMMYFFPPVQVRF
ncbi:hypothetical protein PTMSG1_08039 [Pyrenophora teres f. maculata]|nr:hypothetical protein PTMSG1_08039 [Pyrenophora teres f. maculata]